MSPEIMATITAVVALIIAGVALAKARQQRLNLENVTTALRQGSATATEIMEIVRAGVFAAEQLKATGKLPDNNAAFEYAYLHARKFLPDLGKEALTTFIEANVLLAKQIVGGLPEKQILPKPHINPEIDPGIYRQMPPPGDRP